MSKYLILILLFAGVSIQQCTVGCLKCNSSNKCLLCDVTSLYVFSGAICVVSTQTNCNILSQTGGCVICNNNFYLDLNTQKCISINSNNLITGCNVYSSNQACASCNGNYFVSAGKCSPVNITVSNCQVYLGNGICSQCGSNFILSNDFSSCIQNPGTSNCLLHTFVGCSACNSGFIQNKNLYFTLFDNLNTLNSAVIYYTYPPFGNWAPLNLCQAVIVPNCAIFASFNVCVQCLPGFYLANGVCIIFPLPTITNCAIYSSLTTCASCSTGYFLNNNGCTKVITIAYCQQYSGSTGTTTCTLCSSAFYINNNVCVPRKASASISNCQTSTINADTCSSCAPGFILTSDSLGCLPLVSNCAVYGSSTFQSLSLQCILCINNFYLSNAVSGLSCVSGTISNCQIYSVNSNSCSQCANSFYLSNGACTAHISIQNCLVYDPTIMNTCSICASGFYNFIYTTVCVQTSVLNNCVNYAFDGNSCTNCAPGFYIAGSICATIPSTYSNCLTFSGTGCTVCNSGFMVNSVGSINNCVMPLNYLNSTINSPCSQMNSPLSNVIPTWTGTPLANQIVLTCLTCNSYMYGYNPQGCEAICVNTSQLILYSGFVAVSNCKRYGYNYATIKTLVCMECASGFFISGYQSLAHTTAATSCLNGCVSTITNSNAVIPDDFLGFVNICISVVATGAFQISGSCQRYARIISTNINSFAGASTAVVSADFKCISPARIDINPPANYLVWTPVLDATSFFVYDVLNPTFPLTTSVDFTYGYSNTLDWNSPVPTVFNYHGLLNQIVDSNSVILPATLMNNHLVNCDIVWNLGAITALGSAFSGGNAGIAWSPLVLGSSYYSCLRCRFGFQLKFEATTSIATNSPFPSCSTMSNCAGSTIVYGGLPTFLNSILSCHVCSSQSGLTNFPTIVVDVDAVGVTVGNNMPGMFLSYTLPGVYAADGLSVINSINGFLCTPAPLVILTSDTTTANNFQNCAVYGVLSPITNYAVPNGAADTNGNFPTISTVQNVCIACAANYFPVYASGANAASGGFMPNSKVPLWSIFSCTAGINCDTSVISQFNSCGKCRSDQETNQPPAYFAFMDFTLISCYQGYTANCFILAASTFSIGLISNACWVCKAGYFLNADSFCEMYRVPNMQTLSPNFVNSFYAKQNYPYGVYSIVTTATDRINVRIHYLLSFQLLQYGANGCSTDYTLAPANSWAPRICVWSSYVYNNTGSYPTISSFIPNCEKYNLTSVLGRNLCGYCVSGFIPSIDGTQCINNAGILNCLFSQSGSNSGLCYQCANNFLNVNGACTSSTIPNCAAYVNDAFSFVTPAVLTCASCLSGFVLSLNGMSCAMGNITNCATYSKGFNNQCTGCASGFMLLALNTIYYCYPVSSTLNCAILQSISTNSGAIYGTISCNKCAANSAVVYGGRIWSTLQLINSPQSFCMPFTQISNCVSYSQNNTLIQGNTFGCLQCSPSFWLSTSSGSCVARKNLPTQCVFYSQIADICVGCAAGFFVASNGQQCTAFPTGIFNCASYSGPNTCTQCVPGSYLLNNICLKSPVILNCQIYSANNTCSNCTSGFVLQNSTSCVSGTANNCVTFKSILECSSCQPGFGFQTVNGVTSCVQINIPNCINSTTTTPFSCLTCAPGYFPSSNGQCTIVFQVIVGCQVYDSGTTCLTCMAGGVLSVSRDNCNGTLLSNYVDPNCANSFILSTPTCTVCKLGYYFSNQTCISCSLTSNSTGCMICDPTNLASCLVCIPGYYMNAQGVCVGVPSTIPAPTNSTPIPASKMRINSWIGIVLMFSFQTISYFKN